MLNSREVSKSDIVFFKNKSGTGSVVKNKNNKFYFMPALKDLRIEGDIKPIAYGESFLFIGYRVLNSGPGHRTIKIELKRNHDSTIFSLEEHFFKKYFGMIR